MRIKDLEIVVTRKAMKSIRMTIKSPDARVFVSAPFWISDYEIESFVLSRWDWVIKNRNKTLLQTQTPTFKPTYVSGEKHLLFGEEYELKVIESTIGPAVQLQYNQILLYVRPRTTSDRKATIMAEWYRSRLQSELFLFMHKWMTLLNEPDISWTIRKMKARWGSCCPSKRNMLFNLELARVPLSCIEYVVVHEFTHLQERYHNAHFKSLMNVHLPQWPLLKKELNKFHPML